MRVLGYVVVHQPGACDDGVYVETDSAWENVVDQTEADRRVAAKGPGDCGFFACALVPVADLAGVES